MLTLYIDADGCPVKEETYRVANRYRLQVYVVSNRYLRTPSSSRVHPIVVGKDLDAADDWIAENASEGDIVVSVDIPLAARCIDKGCRVLGSKGRELTPDSIGDALAGRSIAEHLREVGVITGGPAPLTQKDRSRFLSKLDEIVNATRRAHGG